MGLITNTVNPPSNGLSLSRVSFDLESLEAANGIFRTGHRTDEIMKICKNKELNLNRGTSVCPVVGEV